MFVCISTACRVKCSNTAYTLSFCLFPLCRNDKNEFSKTAIADSERDVQEALNLTGKLLLFVC